MIASMRDSLLPFDAFAPLLQLFFLLALDEDHGLFVINELQVFILRYAHDAKHHNDLVGVGVTWEERLPLQELSEDAAYGPHI